MTACERRTPVCVKRLVAGIIFSDISLYRYKRCEKIEEEMCKMMNVLRTEYVNPQAAASRSSQMNPANTPADSEKKQRTLEEEKKAVQNSLLLMKTTSGDSVGSEESIELLEKKLEELESQIKAGEKKAAEIPDEAGESGAESSGIRIKNNFDVYCKGE